MPPALARVHQALRHFVRDLTSANDAGTIHRSGRSSEWARLDPPLRRRIFREQFLLLNRSTPVGSLGSFVAVAVVLGALWGHVEPGPLKLWALAMSVAIALQFVCYFHGLSTRDAETLDLANRYGFLVAFTLEG